MRRTDPFTLAHNGVLHNDRALRRELHLPKTKIETDSYVAVQLLERESRIDFDSLQKMAEALRGSYTITVLDGQNNLYIVRGNNPMCVYHFQRAGFYLYASTKGILDRAVARLHLTKESHLEVSLASGDILRIGANGSLKRGHFNDDALWCGPACFDFYYHPCGRFTTDTSKRRDDEMAILNDYASISSVDSDILTMLRESGYSWLDIKDMRGPAHEPKLRLRTAEKRRAEGLSAGAHR